MSVVALVDLLVKYAESTIFLSVSYSLALEPIFCLVFVVPQRPHLRDIISLIYF